VESVPFDSAEDLISIEAPQQHSYNGLSGGAVVVWDEAAREFVVVGAETLFVPPLGMSLASCRELRSLSRAGPARTKSAP
ncbi:hypothetical protein, partial [Alloalcanivorax venustensis]|uniref:hypothetical protein n=1 Tax=Alloalcanivorax venustensis TaxID=172371 RepID=UPI003515505D